MCADDDRSLRLHGRRGAALRDAAHAHRRPDLDDTRRGDGGQRDLASSSLEGQGPDQDRWGRAAGTEQHLALRRRDDPDLRDGAKPAPGATGARPARGPDARRPAGLRARRRATGAAGGDAPGHVRPPGRVLPERPGDRSLQRHRDRPRHRSRGRSSCRAITRAPSRWPGTGRTIASTSRWRPRRPAPILRLVETHRRGRDPDRAEVTELWRLDASSARPPPSTSSLPAGTTRPLLRRAFLPCSPKKGSFPAGATGAYEDRRPSCRARAINPVGGCSRSHATEDGSERRPLRLGDLAP